MPTLSRSAGIFSPIRIFRNGCVATSRSIRTIEPRSTTAARRGTPTIPPTTERDNEANAEYPDAKADRCAADSALIQLQRRPAHRGVEQRGAHAADRVALAEQAQRLLAVALDQHDVGQCLAA